MDFNETETSYLKELVFDKLDVLLDKKRLLYLRALNCPNDSDLKFMLNVTSNDISFCEILYNKLERGK